MSDPRTQLNRLPERGSDDRELIAEILDDGILCHVGYVIEGRPVVIPTLYARDGHRLLIHGSNTAGMVKAVRRGEPICVTVTHLDALVVARSGFNSSANYRSVIVHGTGRLLAGEEHSHALDLIVEALIPGRTRDIRHPTAAELKQTSVIELDLETASAKTRSGGPHDDPADLDTGVWAGIVPMHTVAGDPVPSEDLEAGVPVPDYLQPGRR